MSDIRERLGALIEASLNIELFDDSYVVPGEEYHGASWAYAEQKRLLDALVADYGALEAENEKLKRFCGAFFDLGDDDLDELEQGAGRGER